MLVFIADALSPAAQAALEAAGHDVVTRTGLKEDALADAVREARPHVLVVRSTKVRGAVLEASPRLELIVRAGAGVDTVDVEGASARGIFVANCPGKNAAAVAELTLGLLLALDRRLPDNVAEARAGRWDKKRFSKAQGLKGRTLGVVGLGSIGEGVVRRAQAFGMEVVAWSRSLDDAKAARLGVTRAESPEAVARQADAVTLHVASTPETRGLAGATFFAAMKPGALFVNTTRGDVVDEAALVAAVREKGLRAALDVHAGEPALPQDALSSALRDEPDVYLTHHIGASTEEAQESIAAEAVRIVNAYAATGEVPNVVNLAAQSPATHLLTVRHLDRVGVLAGVLDEARKAGWNVQEMENVVFSGAQAAVARIRFDGRPDAATLERIRAAEHVLDASVLPL